jgi:hypothetical protein
MKSPPSSVSGCGIASSGLDLQALQDGRDDRDLLGALGVRHAPEDDALRGRDHVVAREVHVHQRADPIVVQHDRQRREVEGRGGPQHQRRVEVRRPVPEVDLRPLERHAQQHARAGAPHDAGEVLPRLPPVVLVRDLLEVQLGLRGGEALQAPPRVGGVIASVESRQAGQEHLCDGADLGPGPDGAERLAVRRVLGLRGFEVEGPLEEGDLRVDEPEEELVAGGVRQDELRMVPLGLAAELSVRVLGTVFGGIEVLVCHGISPFLVAARTKVDVAIEASFLPGRPRRPRRGVHARPPVTTRCCEFRKARLPGDVPAAPLAHPNAHTLAMSRTTRLQSQRNDHVD